MLVYPVTSRGAKIISTFPPSSKEIDVLKLLICCGKDPKDYCLEEGKIGKNKRCGDAKYPHIFHSMNVADQYVEDRGEESSGESDVEVADIKGLTYREERLVSKVVKKLEEKGDKIFRKESTRKVTMLISEIGVYHIYYMLCYS